MSKKFNNSFFKGPQGVLAGIIIAVGLVAALVYLTGQSQSIGMISYKEFLDKVRAGLVQKVSLSGNEVEGVLKSGQRFESTLQQYDANIALLDQHNVDFTTHEPMVGGGIMWQLFLTIGFLVILFALYTWYMASGKGGNSNSSGGGGIFNIGKSRAKMFMPSAIKKKFTDVAGAHEAKEDLQEMVDFLKNPKKYKKIGAKIPRGVLLVGQPGTGKTLLAKAVAGEANCPFFSASGSDFIEVFVGVGASRVRDLFEQAKKNAPCIVFIDEIDAVGRQRGGGHGGGNDEREQTLNQLLTEMDGFEESKDPVIVIAATNRADVLDAALLRPGRFDRQVDVPVPDLKSRQEILAVHLKEVKTDGAIDSYKIARGTQGFTGADLANLVNEAALAAARAGHDQVSMRSFEEARDKIMLGKESKTLQLTEEDKKITAYHEGGHALARLLMPENTDPLHKVTIIPRGRALGVTHFMPEREKYNKTKNEMIANIISALAGRAAEELVFGELTTGAYSDFKHATSIAKDMVCYYGMTDTLGKVVYERGYYGNGFSDKTFERIDAEVKAILDEQYVVAMKLLVDNRDKLDKLAAALLERETMYAHEIYELLGITPRQDHRFVEEPNETQVEQEADDMQAGIADTKEVNSESVPDEASANDDTDVQA